MKLFLIFFIFFATLLSQSLVTAQAKKVNVLICAQQECFLEKMTKLDGDVRGHQLIDEQGIRSLKTSGLSCTNKIKHLKNFSKYIVRCYTGPEVVEKYAVVVPSEQKFSDLLTIFKKKWDRKNSQRTVALKD